MKPQIWSPLVLGVGVWLAVNLALVGVEGARTGTDLASQCFRLVGVAGFAATYSVRFGWLCADALAGNSHASPVPPAHLAEVASPRAMWRAGLSAPSALEDETGRRP